MESWPKFAAVAPEAVVAVVVVVRCSELYFGCSKKKNSTERSTYSKSKIAITHIYMYNHGV